jgi:APA family basic amino acid/polyamine antiporter
MFELPAITWRRFFFWMLAGLVIYVLYGFRRSRLGESRKITGRQQV